MSDCWDPERSCPRVVGSSDDGRTVIVCGQPLPCADHSVESCERPRPFVLHRDDDVTGVSGTGIVAWGVEFPDGVVALRWKGEWPTSVVFHDHGIEAVEIVHGHGGSTRIVWADR